MVFWTFAKNLPLIIKTPGGYLFGGGVLFIQGKGLLSAAGIKGGLRESRYSHELEAMIKEPLSMYAHMTTNPTPGTRPHDKNLREQECQH